jgi:hypothetical protein
MGGSHLCANEPGIKGSSPDRPGILISLFICLHTNFLRVTYDLNKAFAILTLVKFDKYLGHENLALNPTLNWKITMGFIVSTNLGENVYSIAKMSSNITQFGNAINIF